MYYKQDYNFSFTVGLENYHVLLNYFDFSRIMLLPQLKGKKQIHFYFIFIFGKIFFQFLDLYLQATIFV